MGTITTTDGTCTERAPLMRSCTSVPAGSESVT